VEAASSGRILIVDDQEAVCELLSRYLTAEGYHCATAMSGEEAVKLLETGQFDLVLSDIMMPGMSGIDLLNIVRALFPEVAMLMITAVDDKATGILAVELGASGYMIKPFKRNEVLINVANVLRLRGEGRPPSTEGTVDRQGVGAAHPRRNAVAARVHELVSCVRSGMDDADLMKRFDLSASGLREVLDHFVVEGLLKESDVDERPSLSPGTVALDVSRMPFAERDERKPVIKARDAVEAIRAGMDDLSLMERYGISAKGLQSLFKKLVESGRLLPEDLHGRSQPSTHEVVIQDLGRLRKHYLALAAPVYDRADPETMGSIRDVTEKGIGIAGIKANVGDIRTFVIPAQAIPSAEHIWFEAVCLWSGQEQSTGNPVTAFQITKISDECLSTLRKLIDLLCLGR